MRFTKRPHGKRRVSVGGLIPLPDHIFVRFTVQHGKFCLRRCFQISFSDSRPDLIHFAEVLCHLCKKIAVRLRNAFFRRNLADPLDCKRIPLV